MKKTLLAILLAALAPSTYAAQYWVAGVNENGGWVDQDKDRNPIYDEYGAGYFNNGPDGDGFLCWAASATDIITWWHNLNPGAQAINPEAPHTQGDVWNLFKSNFVNASGSASNGIEWYMNGLTTTAEPTPKDPQPSSGAYYPDLELDVRHFDIREFDPRYIEVEGELIFDPYYEGEVGDIYFNIAKTITDMIEDGYIISLGISGITGGKHATTLWGVETDDTTGYLTKMWITDSDDALNGYGTGLFELACEGIVNELMVGPYKYGEQLAYGITSTGKVYAEEEFKETKAGRLWYEYNLESDPARNDYFYDFTAVKMPVVANPGVPEPATGTLSLLALAGMCARRRRD